MSVVGNLIGAWLTQGRPAAEAAAGCRSSLTLSVPFDRTARYLPKWNPTVIYALDKFSVVLEGQPHPLGPQEGMVMANAVAASLMLTNITDPLSGALLVQRESAASIPQQLAGQLRITPVDYVPTVEELARQIYRTLLPHARANNLVLRSVTVHAPEGYAGTYSCGCP